MRAIYPAVGLWTSICVFAATPARAAITYTDDFSGGLNPSVWNVVKSAAHYNVDDTQGDVRITSAAGGGYGYRYTYVYFTPKVVGDFDMRVDFRDARLNVNDVGADGANHVAFHARFGGQHFASTRDIGKSYGSNYHVYLNPPGDIFGYVPLPVSSDSGTLRVRRQGSTYTGFFNDQLIFSRAFSAIDTNPQQLYFSLENNLTNDAISVTYDNFSINADVILGLPDPPPQVPLPAAALAGCVGASLIGVYRRRFAR